MLCVLGMYAYIYRCMCVCVSCVCISYVCVRMHTHTQLSSRPSGPYKGDRPVPGHTSKSVPAQPLARGHVEAPTQGGGPAAFKLLRALKHHQEEVQRCQWEALAVLHHAEELGKR